MENSTGGREVVKIQHIIDPLWSKPAIISHGDKLTIVIDIPCYNIDQFNVSLESDQCLYPLKIDCIAKDVDTNTGITRDGDSTIYQIICGISPRELPGFYSLKIIWKNGSDFMPNSVKIVDRFLHNFRFVHITDPHVCSALYDEPGKDLAIAVKEINKINPEFVLLTGDIASRYDENKQTLDAHIIEHDYRLVQQILLDLKVPIFITAGNHDLAFDFIRGFYRLYFAKPIQGESLDYSFSYGDHRFITFEGFCHYDSNTLAISNKSLDTKQIEWLQSELDSATHSLSRIMFYHYDYQKQLPRIFDKYKVDLALLGHSGPTNEDTTGETPTTIMIDRGVRGDRHIGIIDVSTDSKTDKVSFLRTLYQLC